MIARRSFLIGTAAAGLGVGPGKLSLAQPFPARPIKAVLPYTASSPNDVIARLIATPLSARLGQPVVIENRAGGGTALGLKAVMAAEADGTTLLFTNTPTHVIAHLVSKGFTYDPHKDFTPIVTVASTSLVLVVPASVPANSLQDFIAYAKANPGVPTMIESGLPGLTTVTYYGFLGPAATPVDVVASINSEVNECLKSAELRATMVKVGFEPTGGSPQDFAALIAEQLRHWSPIVKSTSFQME